MAASSIFDASHWLDNEAKSKIISAFSSHGIRVHIDEGELGGGNEVPHKDLFDFENDIGAYRDAYSIRARDRCFHYCVMAHEGPGDILGKSYLCGSSFVVYDGAIRKYWIFGSRVESVFMHELGHNINVYDSDDWPSTGGDGDHRLDRYIWDWSSFKWREDDEDGNGNDLPGDGDNLNEDDDDDHTFEDYCEDPNCAMREGGTGGAGYCAHHWSQVDPSKSFY